VVTLVSFDSFVEPDRVTDSSSAIRYHENGEYLTMEAVTINEDPMLAQTSEDGQDGDDREGGELEEVRPPTALPPTLAALEAELELEANTAHVNLSRRTPNKPSSKKSKRPVDPSRQSVLPSISVVVSAPFVSPSFDSARASSPSALSAGAHHPSPPDPSQLERTILAFAGNDLQVITPGGTLKSRVEPDALVDGVSAMALSVFQQLLFCLLENGHIRIFCTKSATCVLLREVYIGAIGSDEPTALVIADSMTVSSSSSSRTSSTSKDMRGNPSPLNFDEILVIGTSSGTLICLDTFQECQLVGIQQLYHGKIEALKYRRLRKKLIGLGCSLTTQSRTIKIWKVPDMTLMHEIRCDSTFCCWEISPSYGMICFGCTDGFSRLFNLISELPSASASLNKCSLLCCCESHHPLSTSHQP
jgi:hypothetical protein